MIAWNKKDELWIHLSADIEIHASRQQVKFLSKTVEDREKPQSVNIWIEDRVQLKRIRRALKRVHQQLMKAEAKQKKKDAKVSDPALVALTGKPVVTYGEIEARMRELEAEPVLMDHEREEMRGLAKQLSQIKTPMPEDIGVAETDPSAPTAQDQL